MDPSYPLTDSYRRAAVASSRSNAEEEDGTASTAGECKHDEDEDPLLFLSKPTGWIVRSITNQAELLSSAILSLSSPFLSLFFHSRAVPSRVAHMTATTLRRLALGLLGAAYAVISLIVIIALAFLLGFFLVRLWVEEPILLRRPLYFDYTQPQPDAAAMLGRVGAWGRVVPAGHKVVVSLKIVMPESDFNRDVGIFQVSAEAISSNGRVIATSSHPCMLRFSSLPVRLMRTFAMALPLLIGVQTETQEIVFEILRYNEGSQKTMTIKVKLTPRAGTFELPQIYDSEILIHTSLPRRKEVLYNWKWTFYVWVSLNMYVLLLILLFYCFKPFDLLRRRMDSTVQLTEADCDRSHASAIDAKNSEEFTNRVAHTSEFAEGSASCDAGETGELNEESKSFTASESSDCFNA